MGKLPTPPFVSHTVDLLQGIGDVNARRMFGGHGLFLDGLMFALIADNQLYFKADEQSRDAFIERDLPAFTYRKRSGTFALSYYLAPEEVMEDLAAMSEWGNLAFAAALRAAAGKARKHRSGD